ncbi:MAG TPA: S1 RNA-binding domain-containing protein, partial [Dyella sp.]
IAQCGREVRSIIGDASFLRSLKAEQFTDEKFGVPTVRDILKELEKPGRDPRPEFVAPSFAEGVEDVKDLRPGMVLEGRVTNVAAFGAFVDIGVHQDGLVHVSALSHTFVKDPRDAVKAGDIVKVKVMEVDLPRQRIGLSMRLDDEPGQQVRGARPADGKDVRGNPRDNRGPRPAGGGGSGGAPKPAATPSNSAFADAMSRAMKR